MNIKEKFNFNRVDKCFIKTPLETFAVMREEFLEATEQNINAKVEYDNYSNELGRFRNFLKLKYKARIKLLITEIKKIESPECIEFYKTNKDGEHYKRILDTKNMLMICELLGIKKVGYIDINLI